MSGPDELYPPIQYGWPWLLIAVTMIVLAVLAVWLVLFLTRPKSANALVSEVPVGPGDLLAELRVEYLQAIDRVEQTYAEGGIDARRANQEYSKTVRAFVNEYSGLEAPVLALDDLIRLGVHPSLIDALHRHYYPSIFRRGAVVEPDIGAEAARKVVNEWF